tara:strand:- start:414 stop:800 length:387 start_codon:yes stop_codon:yes gene_type:complete
MTKKKAEVIEDTDARKFMEQITDLKAEIKDLRMTLDKQAKIIRDQYALRYKGNRIGDILGDISLNDLLEIIMHQRHNMVFKYYQVPTSSPMERDGGFLIDLDLDSSPYVCPDGALHIDFKYSPDNYET